MPTRTRKAAPAPEPEVVEDEFEELEDDEVEATDEAETTDDLDELEEMEEEEPEVQPTKGKATKAKAASAKRVETIEFGSNWLAEYVTTTTGDKYDGRAIRMLLRKLANDGKTDRVVGETRTRYSFSGPDDPTVKAVLEMIKSGEAKAMKQAGLDKLKTAAAAKKAKAAPVETDEDEDVEDEVEEEAPKPAPRRAPARKAAPAKAAPAKATPATTRRKAPAAK